MQPSTFRMIPNATKQRIFVIKSNINSRSVINPKQEVYETITLNSDTQNRRIDSNEAAKNAQIDRLMNLPSNLVLKSSDNQEEQVIKNVLNDLVQKVSKNDQAGEMHRTVVLRNQSNQPQSSLMPKRYCTFKPIEEKLQPYVERLRSEINKRRHRIEIECANDLGLNSPWRRTRYHRKTPKYEEERPTGPINPSTISLNFDGQSDTSQMHNSYDQQQFDSQSSYYSETPQQMSSGNSIIVGGNDQSQQHYYNEISNEDRSGKKFKPELERCPVCTRECRKTLFCLCCGGCGRRFHGKCVKMTVKRLNKRQAPWFCDECANVPIGQPPAEDLFCLCKKPYDNKEFYVGCDGCDGWFHPSCVGSSQQEIENIEGGAFFCPNCQRRNSQLMQSYGYAG